MKAHPSQIREVHLDKKLIAVRTDGYIMVSPEARRIGVNIPNDQFQFGYLRIGGTRDEQTECLSDIWGCALTYVESHPESIVSVIDGRRALHSFGYDDLPALRKNNITAS